MPFAAAAKNLMLDRLDEATAGGASHASLHTAYSTSGANEVTGGVPPYARKAVVWNAASGGSKALNAAVTFDVPAATTVRWVGFWDAITAGTFLGMTPAGAGALRVFTVDDASTDVLDSPAHGFTAAQTVVVWGVAGTGLPAGLAEGTVYHVRDVTTDTFKLAATAGGAAIDLTAVGKGFVQLMVEESFGGQGTYALTSASLDLAAA
jgi:hypothetical protein